MRLSDYHFDYFVKTLTDYDLRLHNWATFYLKQLSTVVTGLSGFRTTPSPLQVVMTLEALRSSMPSMGPTMAHDRVAMRASRSRLFKIHVS